MSAFQVWLARMWLFLPLVFSLSIVSYSYWKQYPEFRFFSIPIFVAMHLTIGFIFLSSMRKEGEKLPTRIQVAKLLSIVVFTFVVTDTIGIERVVCTYLATWAGLYPFSLYRKPMKVVES